MYVHGLSITGLADLPSVSLSDLGRRVSVKGPTPAAMAIGDGLTLAFSALSPHILERLLCHWGLSSPGSSLEIDADPLPTQAVWEDRTLAKSIVADPRSRKIQVQVSLALDPPLFSDLRALAPREPRLGMALGAGPMVTLEISAFFAASWDAISLSIQSFSLGEERFPSHGPERPAWLTVFLQKLGQRFWMHDVTEQTAKRALEMMLSKEPEPYERYRAWQSSLSPDFGCVRPAYGVENEPILLSENRPMSRYGVSGMNRVQLASSIFLSNTDVLWLGTEERWADQFVKGDGSPLEQLWTVGPEGNIDPVQPQGPRSVLSFGTEPQEE
jgi:hypothetical protein